MIEKNKEMKKKKKNIMMMITDEKGENNIQGYTTIID